MSVRSVGTALAKIAGGERVSTDPGRLTEAAVDGVSPRWVVRVADVEQVAAVLAVATEESLAVVPRGSGRALDLGRPPERVDVVLDLSGMQRVIDYNADDLTATVEAGLTMRGFAARLAARRQFLPIDPPGAASRTLGGLVATGAHGPLRARYGTLRDVLLGVRFVQPDGVVTWGGARVVKSVTGYDVPKLMVGALGTLGVLVELTFRLHPRPDAEATRLLTFDSVDAAGDCVARVLDSALQPDRIEFLDGAALRRLEGDDRGVAAVLISFGSVETAVGEQGARVERLAREGGGRAEARPAEIWERYGSTIDDRAHALALRVSSVPSELVETARRIENVVADTVPGGSAIVAGCAAFGTFDVLLGASAVPVGGVLIERLRALIGARGGHVVVRRAPPAVRRAIDPWGPVDAGSMALMQALRDEFDPKRVLNPGRFLV